MIEIEVTVTEVLPNATVRVRLANGHQIRAYLAGKIRQNYSSGDSRATESTAC